MASVWFQVVLLTACAVGNQVGQTLVCHSELPGIPD